MRFDAIDFCVANAYYGVRLLPSGEWAAIHNFLFTTGLMVGLDRTGYRTRFCYESVPEALVALEAWDGQGWPPGYWIKQKPEGILNPLGR